MRLFDFEVLRADDVDRSRRFLFRRLDPRRADNDSFCFRFRRRRNRILSVTDKWRDEISSAKMHPPG